MKQKNSYISNQYFNKDLEIIEEIENETLNISDEEVDKDETIIKIDKPEKEINMNICENIKDNGKFSKPNIKTINDSNEILESHIEKKTENSFIFDGKMFKKHTKLSNYIRKDNIKRYIYKCEYNRHNEKLRQELKRKHFVMQQLNSFYQTKKLKVNTF